MKSLQLNKIVRLLRPNFALHALHGVDQGIEQWISSTSQDDPRVMLTITDSVDVAASARWAFDGPGAIILISNQPETVEKGIAVVDADPKSLAEATWKELMKHYP